MPDNAVINSTSHPQGFYIVGGSLRRDAACYVERRADAELYAGLSQGNFCYVLTSRQMGKSSLMVRTAARLREEGVGVAVLDLTAIGQNLSAEQWYGGLLSQMGRRLDLEEELLEFWESHPRLGPLQRWMQAIRDVVLPRYLHHKGRVVIFVDEIDAVRSLPFSTDEFFAGIREFYNRRTEDPELERLTFCLLGVATPSDLIRDTRTTPFNIGQRIELHDFTEAEAAPLAQGLGCNEQPAMTLLNRVLYWTGGHPYLTQRLCQAIAETDQQSASELTGSNQQSADRLCADMFLARHARERDDNLLFVRERLLRSEADLASLLNLYARVARGKRVPDDGSNPLVSVLRLSGIASSQNGNLRVRNRIYGKVFDREWVKANMPDAEQQRQRAAYRKGLLRATAVAALILAVVTGLAVAALTQRNRAEAEARRADLSREQAIQSAEQVKQALAETRLQRQTADEQRAEAEKRQLEAISLQMLADQQRGFAEQQSQMNRRLLYAAQMKLAEQAYESTDIERMDDLLAGQIPKPNQEDLRGFDWYYLWRLSHSGQVILRQEGDAYSVAISSDGKMVATGGSDGGVKLWDAVTRRELAALPDRSSPIYSVAFSPNGKILATGRGDATVKLWDVTAGQTIAVFTGHTDAVRAVAFSPDGKTLATAGNDKTAKLWDVDSARARATLANHQDLVGALAFSPDGRLLATASYDKTAKLWNAATGKLMGGFTEHSGGVYAVAFSPDGKRLATGSADRSVKLWDIATPVSLATLRRHTNAVQCVAFSPDGRLLATGGMSSILKLWDVATEQELSDLKGHGRTVWAATFSPDGRTLLTGGGDGQTRWWDIGSEQEERAFFRGRIGSKPLAFSADNRLLAARSENQKTLRLYDTTLKQEIATFTLRSGTILTSAAFSPTGEILAATCDDRTVRLWELATKRELPSLKGHAEVVGALTFSADGKKLATVSADRTVKLWDVATQRLLATFAVESEMARTVTISPDGRLLASASLESVKLWDTTTRQERAGFKAHSKPILSVVFSPDGKLLAISSEDRTIKLWDVAAGRETATLKAYVYSMAFSPDGKRLATGGYDQTIRLWDTITGQELITLRDHAAAVTQLLFSADGKTLSSISSEGRVKLWRAASDEAIATQLR